MQRPPRFGSTHACQSLKLVSLCWAAAHLAGHEPHKSWRCRCQPPHPPCCDPSVPRQPIDPDAWGLARPSQKYLPDVCRRRPCHLPSPKGLRGRRHCCPAACDRGRPTCRDRLSHEICCKLTSVAVLEAVYCMFNFTISRCRCTSAPQHTAHCCLFPWFHVEKQVSSNFAARASPTFIDPESQGIYTHRVTAQATMEQPAFCLPLAAIM